MKILFLICTFPPEISTGRLGLQICKSFKEANNSVTVVTCVPRRYLVHNAVHKLNKFYYSENIDGLKVIRVGPEFPQRDNMLMRGFEYFFSFFSYFIGGLFTNKTDVIMLCCPPLSIAIAGHLLAKIKRVPLVVRVGDLHPQELIDLKMVNNELVVSLLSIMEHYVYKKSDCMTVLSDGYRKHMLNKGADDNKIVVLPNWGDPYELNSIKKFLSWEFKGKFVVTYAGILSWFQDLETLIEAANILRNHKEIKFLIVGDGPQKQSLHDKCCALGLENITFKPLEPRDEYLQTLLNSDVCVVAIKKELTTTTIPSKIFDIMVCSKPVLAIVPKGEITELISKSKSGYSAQSGNAQEVANYIIKLYENPKFARETGLNGRCYLETHFTLKIISAKHQEIMKTLIKNKYQEAIN
jgi:glycosyltransferase involved in cell wall biosynthesis